MSPEALRAALFAAGSMLIAVGGFDDTLVAAGLPALGLISAGVAKILMAAGALMLGYAKRAKALGDFSLADVSEALRDTVAPAKSAAVSEPKTEPGLGPKG